MLAVHPKRGRHDEYVQFTNQDLFFGVSIQTIHEISYIHLSHGESACNINERKKKPRWFAPDTKSSNPAMSEKIRKYTIYLHCKQNGLLTAKR